MRNKITSCTVLWFSSWCSQSSPFGRNLCLLNHSLTNTYKYFKPSIELRLAGNVYSLFQAYFTQSITYNSCKPSNEPRLAGNVPNVVFDKYLERRTKAEMGVLWYIYVSIEVLMEQTRRTFCDNQITCTAVMCINHSCIRLCVVEVCSGLQRISGLGSAQISRHALKYKLKYHDIAEISKWGSQRFTFGRNSSYRRCIDCIQCMKSAFRQKQQIKFGQLTAAWQCRGTHISMPRNALQCMDGTHALEIQHTDRVQRANASFVTPWALYSYSTGVLECKPCKTWKAHL